MSRRKTVQLDVEVILKTIKKECRSYTVFCEKMGRANNWATDWNRKGKDGKPAPKNLPSPEEAARMCAILNVRPEEILVEQADIELVRGLIESQRGEGQKEKHSTEGEVLSEVQLEAINFIKTLNEDELRRFIKMGEAAFSNNE